MNSRINFVLGLALLAVAGAVAVAITTRSAPAYSHAGAPGSAAAESSPALAGAPDRSVTSRPVSRSERRPTVPLGVVVDPSHPERRELEERAKRVDEHARTQLARLTRDLDLSLDQQRRIYPKLVAASDSYHPAMQIVGAGGAAAVPGPLEPELDPLQRDQLVDREIEDLVLWQAIIAQLQSDLEARTPLPGPGADPGPLPAADPVPAGREPPASGGGRNLFDMVPPAE